MYNLIWQWRGGQNETGGNIVILDVAKALQAGCLIEDLRNHRYLKGEQRCKKLFGYLH